MNASATPTTVVDDEFCELVDGQLFEKPMWAGTQIVVSDVAGFVGSYIRKHQLGRTVNEAKFALPHNNNHRIPAVAYVSYGQWPRSKRLPNGPVWDIAPDLAIDVVGSSDNAVYQTSKVIDYFTAGCKAVWIVWPNLEQVHVYASPTSVRIFAQGDILEGDPVVPGFRLAISDLFPSSELE